MPARRRGARLRGVLRPDPPRQLTSQRHPARTAPPGAGVRDRRRRLRPTGSRASAPRIAALCVDVAAEVARCDETRLRRDGRRRAARRSRTRRVARIAAGEIAAAGARSREPLDRRARGARAAARPRARVSLRGTSSSSPFPPSFRDPTVPLPPTRKAASLRSTPRAASADGGDADVDFTLGTVFNVESGDLFTRVLAGLRDLPIEVVATVGREIDPAELGPQPPHVRIERFVPQSDDPAPLHAGRLARRLGQRARRARARPAAGAASRWAPTSR